jgi:hypothetical protein
VIQHWYPRLGWSGIPGAGDVLHAASRIDGIEDAASGSVVTTTLVGLRGVPAAAAWERDSPALFVPERDKPRGQRISDKCVEVTRRFLYRAPDPEPR